MRFGCLLRYPTIVLAISMVAAAGSPRARAVEILAGPAPVKPVGGKRASLKPTIGEVQTSLSGEGGGAGEVSPCQACNVGSMDCGVAVIGTLSANDCRLDVDDSLIDVWALEINDPVSLTLEYTSDDFDPYLFLLDLNCEIVAFNDDCTVGDLSRSCITIDLTPGEYFVMANTFSPGESGQYALSASCTEVEVLCEGRCVAGSIECGQDVSGSLTSNDCVLPQDGSFVDIYTFDLENDTNVSIELESDAFDTYLWVYDVTCQSVASNDDCSENPETSCLDLNLSAGRWSIVVNSFRAGENGAYTLRVRSCREPVSICEGCVVGEAICDGVNVGEILTSGCRFSNNRPFDVWTLRLEEESDVQINLRSQDFDPNLFITDTDCEITRNNDDCDGAGLDSCLTIEGMAPGTYAIVASAFREDAVGGYELEVQATSCTPSKRDCEICPAAPISCETGMVQGLLPDDSCTLENAGRVVYHELIVPAATTVRLDLDASFDTLLTITNDRCEEIDRNDDCPSPPGTLDSCLEVNLPAGRFFVGAASLFASESGPYTLTIECEDESAPNILAGDCDASGQVNLADAICLFNFLFLGGEVEVSLPCSDGTLASASNVRLMDWNADEDVNLTDGIGVLNYLFLGGAPHSLGLDSCVNIPGCPTRCAQ